VTRRRGQPVAPGRRSCRRRGRLGRASPARPAGRLAPASGTAGLGARLTPSRPPDILGSRF